MIALGSPNDHTKAPHPTLNARISQILEYLAKELTPISDRRDVQNTSAMKIRYT